jgi:hypothetical protein
MDMLSIATAVGLLQSGPSPEKKDRQSSTSPRTETWLSESTLKRLTLTLPEMELMRIYHAATNEELRHHELG